MILGLLRIILDELSKDFILGIFEKFKGLLSFQKLMFSAKSLLCCIMIWSRNLQMRVGILKLFCAVLWLMRYF